MRYCRNSDILASFSSVVLASGTASSDPNYDLTALSHFDLGGAATARFISGKRE